MTGGSKLNIFVSLPAKGYFSKHINFIRFSFQRYSIRKTVFIENSCCINYFRKLIVISGRIFLHKELEARDVRFMIKFWSNYTRYYS